MAGWAPCVLAPSLAARHPQGPRQIHFAVDYVYPVGSNWAYAYDPDGNLDDGFKTDWSGPATQVGDLWPLALAPAVPIDLTCN